MISVITQWSKKAHKKSWSFTRSPSCEARHGQVNMRLTLSEAEGLWAETVIQLPPQEAIKLAHSLHHLAMGLMPPENKS